MTLLLVAQGTSQKVLTCVMMYSSSQGGFEMIDTCILHDDYEDFAKKYLGIDYDDFVNLERGLDDGDVYEIEYPVMI